MSRSINPRPQFFDNSGDPLVSGKMYFFDSGTNTQKITYADAALTIPNSHPVLLDAAGRLPNVFFNGSAKQVLTDADDVQIWSIDPVTSDTASGGFGSWNSTTTYDTNDIVQGSDGAFYISITSGNVNNDPTTSLTNWSEVRFLGVYNTNESYALNDVVVTGTGQIYISLSASNQGNAPASSPTKWQNINGTYLQIASARPTDAQTGLLWVDNTTNPSILYYYDGADDIKIGELDTTANLFTPDLTDIQALAYLDGGTAGGTKNALTLSPSPSIAAYAAGMEFVGVIGGTDSDSTVTLAVSGLTAKNVFIDGSACSATKFLQANKTYKFRYDGTQFNASLLSSDYQGFLTGTHDYFATTSTTNTTSTSFVNTALTITFTPRSATSTLYIISFAEVSTGSVTGTPSNRLTNVQLQETISGSSNSQSVSVGRVISGSSSQLNSRNTASIIWYPTNRGITAHTYTTQIAAGSSSVTSTFDGGSILIFEVE